MTRGRINADNCSMTKNIVKMIVVDADGEIITAANGLVSSDNPQLVKEVKRRAMLGTYVRFVEPYGREVQASLADPSDSVKVAAALFAARPGRTKLLAAPDEVMAWISEDFNAMEPASFEDDITPEQLDEMSVTLLLESGTDSSSVELDNDYAKKETGR